MLKHSESYTDQHDLSNPRQPELSPGGFHARLCLQRPLDVGHLTERVGEATNPGKNVIGQIVTALSQQPSWTFGDQERSERKHDRRHNHGAEHPAPTVLNIPRLQEHGMTYVIGNWAGDLPVCNLCQKNTKDNRKLIQTDQSTAYRRWADLSDIQRRDIRAHPDCSTAHNPPKDKGGERIGPTSQPRGDSKQNRGDEKDSFAAKTLPGVAGQEGTCKTSNESTAIRPADELFRGELKIGLVELTSPSDHDPVVAKQQSAHRCHQCDRPEIDSSFRRSVHTR